MRQVTKEEELGLRKNARKVNMKDEYYVSADKRFMFLPFFSPSRTTVGSWDDLSLESKLANSQKRIGLLILFANHVAPRGQGLGQLGTEAGRETPRRT